MTDKRKRKEIATKDIHFEKTATKKKKKRNNSNSSKKYSHTSSHKEKKNPINQKSTKKNRKNNQSKKPNKKQKNNSNKTQHPLKNVLLNFVFYGFVLLMVTASILFASSKSEDKSLLGYRFFGVLTDSMVPRDPKNQKDGFHSGDIIIIKNIEGEQAETGDIITFRPNIKSQAFLTHRVKKKMDHLGESKGTYYITQGDANLAEDVPISSKQVVGKKVFVIPKVGAVLNFVRENIIVSLLFVISIVGFITVMRYYILNK